MSTATSPGRSTALTAARWALAIGALSFGSVNATFGSFALQFQPVPPPFDQMPWLALACALVLVLAGALLWFRDFALAAAATLAAWFASWILLLHVQRIPGDRLQLGHLLPASEVLACAAAAGLLASALAGSRRWAWVWLRLLALAQIVFGLCHVVYLDITAGMIPSYFPARPALAMATGVAHLVAAVVLFTGIGVRRVAPLLALMYLGFLLLVCVPLLLADPYSHLRWIMCIVTWLCGVAAWLSGQQPSPDRLSDAVTLPLAATTTTIARPGS